MNKATWSFFTRGAILLLSGLLFKKCEAESSSEPKNVRRNCVNVEATSFMELVDKSYAFVDKTLFIKDFLEAKLVPHYMGLRGRRNTTNVMRVCYPRKWGKTMNMKMLEDFLQMEVDDEGNQISPKDTAAYRLFALGKTASDSDVQLHITSHRRIIHKYLAQHPVIYVSFKNVTGLTYNEIYLGAKRALAETFSKHAYMTKVFQNVLKNTSSSDEAKKKTKDNLERFQAILSTTSDPGTTVDSLVFLSSVLHEHFGKRVFLLFDDHDQPFLSMFTQKAANLNELERALYFTLILIPKTLEEKIYEKMFITGVVIVEYLEIDDWHFRCLFHPLALYFVKYFAEFSVLRNRFFKHYGFSQNEVNVLFDKLRINQKLSSDAEKWYKGYSMTDTPALFRDFVEMYNPYDVVKFLHRGKISNYWAKSGAVAFAPNIFRNKHVESFILSLLNKEEVIVESDDLGCGTAQLKELATALNPKISVLSSPLLNGHKANTYFEYLLMTGYLTLRKATDSPAMTFVRIPNEEITTEIVSLMIQHYRDTYSIPLDIQNRLSNDLKRLPKVNDTFTFKRSLEAFFPLFPEFVDQTNSNHEDSGDVINSAFNLLTLIVKDVYQLNSNIYLMKRKNKCSTSRMRPNIVLNLEEMNLGIIILLLFNVTFEKTRVRARNHTTVFDNHKSIENTRLIEINVFPNKTVELKESRKSSKK